MAVVPIAERHMEYAENVRQQLQSAGFRVELFNAFNHPVFAQPDNYITDGPGATGVITSTVLPQREMQFGLKLHF